MDINSVSNNQTLISENPGTLRSDEVTPQKAVNEVVANKQENVNMQFGIEALKQSIQNDPVAQILNILV